jgi:hypothetical protein
MKGKDIGVVLIDEAVDFLRLASEREFASLDELKEYTIEELLPQNSEQVRRRYASLLTKRLFEDDPYYDPDSEDDLDTPLVRATDRLDQEALELVILYHYAQSNELLRMTLVEFLFPASDEERFVTARDFNSFLQEHDIDNAERTQKDLLRCFSEFGILDKEESGKYAFTGRQSLNAFAYAIHHELGEPQMYFIDDVLESLTRRSFLLQKQTVHDMVYDGWHAEYWEYSFISDMEQVKLYDTAYDFPERLTSPGES